eukprot:TRINITY_DN962_c0_g2_i5.p1 TRINITY_DN962_c0_g2~~TRINITY_DN962_c0_g2_i5.p1  ORF type:complete len:3441 (+),score=511.54 TRINITY_DN962_c0_g2_i5:5-10327(+)
MWVVLVLLGAVFLCAQGRLCGHPDNTAQACSRCTGTPANAQQCGNDATGGNSNTCGSTCDSVKDVVYSCMKGYYKDGNSCPACTACPDDGFYRKCDVVLRTSEPSCTACSKPSGMITQGYFWDAAQACPSSHPNLAQPTTFLACPLCLVGQYSPCVAGNTLSGADALCVDCVSPGAPAGKYWDAAAACPVGVTRRYATQAPTDVAFYADCPNGAVCPVGQHSLCANGNNLTSGSPSFCGECTRPDSILIEQGKYWDLAKACPGTAPQYDLLDGLEGCDSCGAGNYSLCAENNTLTSDSEKCGACEPPVSIPAGKYWDPLLACPEGTGATYDPTAGLVDCELCGAGNHSLCTENNSLTRDSIQCGACDRPASIPAGNLWDPLLACPAGTGVTYNTTTGIVRCTDCLTTQYSLCVTDNILGPDDTLCTACDRPTILDGKFWPSSCPGGVLTLPEIMGDCEQCDPGFYSPCVAGNGFEESKTCVPCVRPVDAKAGEYWNASKVCPVGTFYEEDHEFGTEGFEACHTCPFGNYSNCIESNTVETPDCIPCDPCVAGYYSPCILNNTATTGSCERCDVPGTVPAGHYWDPIEICVDRFSDTAPSIEEATDCPECPVGQYSTCVTGNSLLQNGVFCKPCDTPESPQGKFWNLTEACPFGVFPLPEAPTTGYFRDCPTCQPGEYSLCVTGHKLPPTGPFCAPCTRPSTPASNGKYWDPVYACPNEVPLYSDPKNFTDCPTCDDGFYSTCVEGNTLTTSADSCLSCSPPAASQGYFWDAAKACPSGQVFLETKPTTGGETKCETCLEGYYSPCVAGNLFTSDQTCIACDNNCGVGKYSSSCPAENQFGPPTIVCTTCTCDKGFHTVNCPDPTWTQTMPACITPCEACAPGNYSTCAAGNTLTSTSKLCDTCDAPGGAPAGKFWNATLACLGGVDKPVDPNDGFQSCPACSAGYYSPCIEGNFLAPTAVDCLPCVSPGSAQGKFWDPKSACPVGSAPLAGPPTTGHFKNCTSCPGGNYSICVANNKLEADPGCQNCIVPPSCGTEGSFSTTCLEGSNFFANAPEATCTVCTCAQGYYNPTCGFPTWAATMPTCTKCTECAVKYYSVCVADNKLSSTDVPVNELCKPCTAPSPGSAQGQYWDAATICPANAKFSETLPLEGEKSCTKCAAGQYSICVANNDLTDNPPCQNCSTAGCTKSYSASCPAETTFSATPPPVTCHTCTCDQGKFDPPCAPEVSWVATMPVCTRTCDDCTDGEYSPCVQDNTQTSGACTDCAPNPEGQYNAACAGDRTGGVPEYKNCTTCPPGYYSPCVENNRFSSDQACIPCSTCGEGKYNAACAANGLISDAGTSPMDCKVCTPCGLGKYSTCVFNNLLFQDPGCQSCKNCSQGQHSTVCLASTNFHTTEPEPECKNCFSSTGCDQGKFYDKATACPVGTFSSSPPARATACKDCMTCVRGQYSECVANNMLLVNPGCKDCNTCLATQYSDSCPPAITFSETVPTTNCTPCTCGAGLYSENNCPGGSSTWSATMPTCTGECTVCDEGEYSPCFEGNTLLAAPDVADECIVCSCKQGEFLDGNCPEGTWAKDMPLCTGRCEVCSAAGKYSTCVTGNVLTEDPGCLNCLSCGLGQYNTACLGDTWSESVPSNQCEDCTGTCGVGTYNNACPPENGLFADPLPKCENCTSTTGCPVGKYNNACPANNRLFTDPGTPQCEGCTILSCPGGQFNNACYNGNRLWSDPLTPACIGCTPRTCGYNTYNNACPTSNTPFADPSSANCQPCSVASCSGGLFPSHCPTNNEIFVNPSPTCGTCGEALVNCLDCESDEVCRKCALGTFLNSTTKQCQPCRRGDPPAGTYNKACPAGTTEQDPEPEYEPCTVRACLSDHEYNNACPVNNSLFADPATPNCTSCTPRSCPVGTYNDACNNDNTPFIDPVQDCVPCTVRPCLSDGSYNDACPDNNPLFEDPTIAICKNCTELSCDVGQYNNGCPKSSPPFANPTSPLCEACSHKTCEVGQFNNACPQDNVLFFDPPSKCTACTPRDCDEAGKYNTACPYNNTLFADPPAPACEPCTTRECPVGKFNTACPKVNAPFFDPADAICSNCTSHSCDIGYFNDGCFASNGNFADPPTPTCKPCESSCTLGSYDTSCPQDNQLFFDPESSCFPCSHCGLGQFNSACPAGNYNAAEPAKICQDCTACNSTSWNSACPAINSLFEDPSPACESCSVEIPDCVSCLDPTYECVECGTGFYVVAGQPRCSSECGDGLLAGPEGCDDNNTIDGDGCSSTCTVEVGWNCTDVTLEQSHCSIICGDNLITATFEDHADGIISETCDDGNTNDGDGCSSTCQTEFGYYCSVGSAPTLTPKICTSICGDGQHVAVGPGEEGCDDGNNLINDGCDASCKIESGWTCATDVNGTSHCLDVSECADAIANYDISLCKLPNGLATVYGAITCYSDNVTYSFPDIENFPELEPNKYRCVCPPGYQAIGWGDSVALRYSPDYEYEPGADSKFQGCFDVDECATYGCTNVPTKGIQVCHEYPGVPNQRTCSCAEGTLEYESYWTAGNTSVPIDQNITGNNTATLICTAIDLCDSPGCGTYAGAAVPCTLIKANQRTCECPNALVAETLTGNDPFRGCASKIIVEGSTPLGYTSSKSYWTNWENFALYDFSGDGFIDVFYTTKTSRDIAWLKNNGGQAVAFEREPIRQDGLTMNQVCKSPTPVKDFPSVYGSSKAVICFSANGALQAWLWSAQEGNFRRNPDWVQSTTFGLSCDRCTDTPVADGNYKLSQTASGDFNSDTKLDFLVVERDQLKILLTTAHQHGSYLTVVFDQLPLPVSITAPRFFDFDDDGELDFLFAESEAKLFYWYRNAGKNNTHITFELKGAFPVSPTGTPKDFLVGKFDDDEEYDMVALCTECYEMFYIRNFPSLSTDGLDGDYPARAGLSSTRSYRIGRPDEGGCGYSGGAILEDINQDGKMDVVNFLSGGVEILLNVPSGDTNTFEPQKILGGANIGFSFDMDSDGTKDIVAISDGITAWYKLTDPNECVLGVDNCTLYDNTICANNGWKGFKCVCPIDEGFEVIINETAPVGEQEICANINECLNENGGCEQGCEDENGSYHCYCDSGYVLTGAYACQNINECTNATICDVKNGDCKDTPGSYNCVCNQGWQLSPQDNRTCLNIDECSSPLLNECDHYCHDNDGSYTCSCDIGYKLTFNERSKMNSDCILQPCFWNNWNPWSSCVCGKDTTRIRVQNTAASENSILCFQNLTQETALCPAVKYCKSDQSDPADPSEACALVSKSFADFYFQYTFPEMMPVSINCSADSGTWIISTNFVDEDYLKNATAILQTEASYILGVPEDMLAVKITFGNETLKRDSGFAARINFDIGGAYPPDYLIIIVVVSVATTPNEQMGKEASYQLVRALFHLHTDLLPHVNGTLLNPIFSPTRGTQRLFIPCSVG